LKLVYGSNISPMISKDELFDFLTEKNDLTEKDKKSDKKVEKDEKGDKKAEKDEKNDRKGLHYIHIKGSKVYNKLSWEEFQKYRKTAKEIGLGMLKKIIAEWNITLESWITFQGKEQFKKALEEEGHKKRCKKELAHSNFKNLDSKKLLAEDIMDCLNVVRNQFEWFGDEEIEEDFKVAWSTFKSSKKPDSRSTKKPLWWMLRFDFQDACNNYDESLAYIETILKRKETADNCNKVVANKDPSKKDKKYPKSLSEANKKLLVVKEALKKFENKIASKLSKAMEEGLKTYIQWYIDTTGKEDTDGKNNIYKCEEHLYAELVKLRGKPVEQDIFLHETYLSLTKEQIPALKNICGESNSTTKTSKKYNPTTHLKLLKHMYDKAGFGLEKLHDREEAMEIILTKEFSKYTTDNHGKFTVTKRKKTAVDVLGDFLQQLEYKQGINHFRQRAHDALDGEIGWTAPAKKNVKQIMRKVAGRGKHLMDSMQVG